MARPLLLLLASLLLAAAAQAQPRGTVTGRVVDAGEGTPIPSATTALWHASDSTLATGTITDAEGRFRLEGLAAGRYYAVVSFVGYTSATVSNVVVAPGATVDVGIVALAPGTALLEGVEVTAARPTIEVKIDRTVYPVADTPVAAGGTAGDALGMIPSVDVDFEGNVSLRGSGNVAILVNGRPAPVPSSMLADYLQQLPASVIERVEVIPNPSARYEPDGMSGIINIVLKQNTRLGWGATLSAGGDTRGGYNGSATLTYGDGPLNLTASYGLRRGERAFDGASYRINRYLTPATYLDQQEEQQRAFASHFLNLTVDYGLARRTTLTASVQGGLRGGSGGGANTVLMQDAAGLPALAYERRTDTEGDGLNGELRLGVRHDFGGTREREHTLVVEAQAEASTESDAARYAEHLLAGAGTLEPDQRTDEREREQEWSLKADYVRPLGAFRLEVGYQGDLELTHSTFFAETRAASGAFVPEDGLNNTFDFREQVHAAYVQLARELGALGVQAGLRAETARRTFDLLTTQEAYENTYASLFPSLFLTYALNDANTLRASYSRRINRPRTRWLNPFPSYDDPLNLRVGNPALRPEYVDALELGFVRYTGWGTLTFSPYYRRTTDVVRRIQVLRPDGVTVRTSENLDESRSYGMELIGSFEGRGGLQGLRGYASLEGYRLQTDGASAGSALQNDAFGWGGRLNASYRLGFGLDVQATLRYRAPLDTEQGRVGASFYTDLAVRQELLEGRANLVLRVRDLFGTSGFSYVLDEPMLYQRSERGWSGQVLGFTASYTLGQAQRNRDRGERGGQEEGFDGEVAF